MQLLKYHGLKKCTHVPEILRPKMSFLYLELEEFRDESGVLFEGIV